MQSRAKHMKAKQSKAKQSIAEQSRAKQNKAHLFGRASTIFWGSQAGQARGTRPGRFPGGTGAGNFCVQRLFLERERERRTLKATLHWGMKFGSVGPHDRSRTDQAVLGIAPDRVSARDLFLDPIRGQFDFRLLLFTWVLPQPQQWLRR